MDPTKGQRKQDNQEKTGASARNSKQASNLYQKSVKPLIEKRRRARINASLEQLKKLLHQPPKEQLPRALSRLEKAEVLEMTVQKLQQLKQQGGTVMNTIPSQDSQDFAAGYFHCINTVQIFLSSAGLSLDQEMKTQILQYLKQTVARSPSSATAPASKGLDSHKPDSFPSSQSSILWAAPSATVVPAELTPFSNVNTFTVESRSYPPSASLLLPKGHVSWTQPATFPSTNCIWRPW